MTEARPDATAPSSSLAGIGIVLLSALLIAFAPNAAKIAYREGADLTAVITFRTLIGAAGLALYLAARRHWPPGGRDAFRRSAFSGLAQVFTALGFIGAVAFIDVSLAALIFYSHPFLVALISHLRGEARMSANRFVWIASAIAGLALVFGLKLASLAPLGIALSLVGMVAVTVLIFTVAGLSAEVGPIPANLFMTTWSCLYLLAFALAAPLTGLAAPMTLPGSVAGWIAILGAGVTTTTGYVLFFVGARIVGTARAAVWTVTEPLFAIIFAVLLIGETLSASQWLGVAIVIGSLIRFETTAAPAPRD
ncbi:DMT family transporter [Defluviimonas sp. WL0024]|uniref:DMT family transporter n=1 Tax=Albidovulum salinarum TaxID=2984153 RepID=A0ABT2X750_9RHOB|nr:DMT family transporter [Defluviimonas sp. WL0024]MCU9849764.1 DMT family transporter [Defluviimonas sp. WL0024]